ncbi:DUF6415 family natural product biosynthesis protein [Streptomyces sp. NPDC005799]|uniref:DUF6415 family natural product biosynthesis protein n=1 Tax=Streptomyces sp. NPDC005799 TaxID=3154678 RepID=UPI0034087681
MAALSPTVPNEAEILLVVEAALQWDLNSTDLPPVDVALDMAEQFTRYGRMVADELRTQCLRIPADSDAGLGAQATLGEAARRLNLKPLARSAAPRSAAHRAQNLARLVQALNRAMDQVREEEAVSAPYGSCCGDDPGLGSPPGRVDHRARAREVPRPRLRWRRWRRDPAPRPRSVGEQAVGPSTQPTPHVVIEPRPEGTP